MCRGSCVVVDCCVSAGNKGIVISTVHLLGAISYVLSAANNACQVIIIRFSLKIKDIQQHFDDRTESDLEDANKHSTCLEYKLRTSREAENKITSRTGRLSPQLW